MQYAPYTLFEAVELVRTFQYLEGQNFLHTDGIIYTVWFVTPVPFNELLQTQVLKITSFALNNVPGYNFNEMMKIIRDYEENAYDIWLLGLKKTTSRFVCVHLPLQLFATSKELKLGFSIHLVS